VVGLTQGADNGEAVYTGKHAVENDGRGVFFGVEEIGESRVAVRFVMSAVPLCLKVEEQALSEVFFVFYQNDERGGGLGHVVLFDWGPIPIRYLLGFIS
jgi:hypothetical protein